MTTAQVRTAIQTFAWPLVLAALTLAALVAGLLGEGVWDALAFVGLAAPTLFGGWKLLRAFWAPTPSERPQSVRS